MKIRLYLLVTCLAFFGSSHKGFSGIEGEYQLKAKYLCVFLKYVTFPNDREKYHIGVLGKNPFKGSLRKFEDQLFNGKKIKIHFFGKDVARANKQKCDILYISSSEVHNQKNYLEKLNTTKTMTVGDNKWFLNSGGMLNLVLKDLKVRWELNPDKLSDADFKVSSKIFRLAANRPTE
ncbi:MAG: YfiR family protein [Lentisphaeraceae bacterium]|nr:YfiR family protein [Lentisphaeraceae bacterium]